jgi:DNA-binding transcriptional LysR family regulator
VDWNDLAYLLAAYRSRSLAGAARELRCEHTTVSRRLAALEAAIGGRLFTRTPEGLVATALAEDLIPLAEQVETTVRAIQRRGAGDDQRVNGCVRLTTSETFGAFIIQRLGELRARHPELIVQVLADNRVLDISRGEADLALRFAETTQRDLVVRTLTDVHWAMYASHPYVARCGAPAPIEDLRGHDIVGYDEALAATAGARWLAAHADGATLVFRGSSMRSVLEATLAGMGLSVLPCQLCDPEPQLVRLSPASLGHRTLCLVVHPDLAKVARVRAVMDFLIEIIGRDRAALLGGGQIVAPDDVTRRP